MRLRLSYFASFVHWSARFGCGGIWLAVGCAWSRISVCICDEGEVISLRESLEGRVNRSRQAKVEGLDECIPPRSNQVLCLDFTGSHLSILRALLYILDEFLLLVLELYSLAVKFSLRLL